jgi:hypothetical protein
MSTILVVYGAGAIIRQSASGLPGRRSRAPSITSCSACAEAAAARSRESLAGGHVIAGRGGQGILLFGFQRARDPGEKVRLHPVASITSRQLRP